MNPSSIYKNQIKSKMSASKSKKSTIHLKDIHKLTPIPTAIKLKTPEQLKSHQECSTFEYPILDIVNTNFKEIFFSFLMLFSFFSLFLIYNIFFLKQRSINFFAEDIYLFFYFLFLLIIFFVFFNSTSSIFSIPFFPIITGTPA